MAKHVYKHRITAVFECSIDYDPAAPATYTAALEHVANLRRLIAELAGTITSDAGKPVVVREVAAAAPVAVIPGSGGPSIPAFLMRKP